MPVTFANASSTISANDSVNVACARNFIVRLKPISIISKLYRIDSLIYVPAGQARAALFEKSMRSLRESSDRPLKCWNQVVL